MRRLLVVGLAALGLFAAFQIVAPLLISSAVVRDRMEWAVAEWTGHDVTIAGTPDIRFWPKPRITLKDITIRKGSEGTERVLARVSRLSAAFDLFDALIGRPEFSDFRLTEPVIHVVREAGGRLDWANDGRLSRAVRDARAEGSGQSLSAVDDAPIGNVRIVNGTLEISDKESGRLARFTAVNGALDWPWLSGGLEIKANTEFNGRKLTLDANSTQPLLLLSGKSGNVSGSVASELFKGRFQGAANIAAHGFFSGDVKLSAFDLSALMAWAGIGFAGAEHLKNLGLDARIVSNNDTLRFEDLSLSLNEAEADGVLDLMLPSDRPPRLTGTLAFDHMDSAALLAAVAPGGTADPALNGNPWAGLELDLRLSAKQAMLGPFRLADAAISVMNVGGQSRVDILDSDFETGRLTGRIATTKGAAAGGLALRLSVQDADFGGMFKELALAGPVPLTRGSLDLSLDLDRPLAAAAWRQAKGTIHFRGGPGTLSRVDLAGIRRLAADKPYFPLSEAGNGALEFDSIDISADLSAGSADIRNGSIVSSGETFWLSGVIPYAANSMALSVGIQPTGQGAPSKPLMMFLGGSWPDPVVWPISQTPPGVLQ